MPKVITKNQDKFEVIEVLKEKYGTNINKPKVKKSKNKTVNKKPVTEKPVTEKPVTKKPVTKKPVTKKPVTNKPINKKLVTKKLVTKKPVTKKLVTKKSAIKKVDRRFKKESDKATNRVTILLTDKEYKELDKLLKGKSITDFIKSKIFK